MWKIVPTRPFCYPQATSKKGKIYFKNTLTGARMVPARGFPSFNDALRKSRLSSCGAGEFQFVVPTKPAYTVPDGWTLVRTFWPQQSCLRTLELALRKVATSHCFKTNVLSAGSRRERRACLHQLVYREATVRNTKWPCQLRRVRGHGTYAP